MNKHIALYRKYRPQKYSDIFSQDMVSEILKNSVQNNRLSHAYIFFGTRGVGKTTIARIFAKSINCENNVGGEACNSCNSCQIFHTSNNVDVIELDAASNNGVEEIRKVINNSRHSPTIMKNKVFIIDEAHMLTSNAWNAFLKTLEEPQPNVVFILATTEFHKLPETIISRCIKISFQRMTNDKIRDIILKVSNEEKVTIEDEALEILVKIANGSARDALSALEQTITISNIIKAETLTQLFGYYSDTKIRQIYSKISKSKFVNNDIVNDLQVSTNYFKLAEDIIKISSPEDFELVDNIIKYFSILKDNQYSKEIFLAILNMNRSISIIDSSLSNNESTINSNNFSNSKNKNYSDLQKIFINPDVFQSQLLENTSLSLDDNIDIKVPVKINEEKKNAPASSSKKYQDSDIINIMLINNENVRTDFKKIKDDFIINSGVHSKTDELLRKSKIIWASKEFVIFLFDSSKDVINFNSICNHSEKLKNLFGKDLFFFSISKFDAKRLTKIMLENKPNPKPFKRFIINCDSSNNSDIDPMELAKELFS